MEMMERYKGGAAAAAADVAWKMDRIMLKYRPIAPKPVCGGAVVAAVPVEAKSSSRRGKRKGCMKEGRRGRKSAKKMAAAAVVEAGAFREEQEKNNSVITLPLMPVTPERKEESPATPTPSPTASGGHVAWQQVGTTTSASGSSCSSSNNNCSNNSSPSVVVAPRPVRAVGSWVTVEGVTDALWEGDTHVSPMAYAALLQRDTSPVLISDACGQVTWTNAAYRRMVVGPSEEDDEQEEEEVMRVALVTRGMVPAGATCFTCAVRVRYACKRRGGKVSMAAPCDVWRLADGRLVWRLDVAAALSLCSLGS